MQRITEYTKAGSGMGVASMPLLFSDFQPLLECFAGRFLVLVEGVGVNVQCGGWLGVSQQTS